MKNINTSTKWNKPSLDFYEAMGARQMDEWTPLRVDGETLQKMGNRKQ